MLQTNELQTPEDWLAWERSTDDSHAGKLEERLDDIAAIFGVDRQYFYQTKILPKPKQGAQITFKIGGRMTHVSMKTDQMKMNTWKPSTFQAW